MGESIAAAPTREKTYVFEIDGRRTVVPARFLSATTRICMRDLEQQLRAAWAAVDAGQPSPLVVTGA